MAVTNDLLERRKRQFVLWSPRVQPTPPMLVIGRVRQGNPPTVPNTVSVPLVPSGLDGLWTLDASVAGLSDNTVYHYWIEVDDARSPGSRIAVTDPFATSVDWRVFAPKATTFTQPAAVIKHTTGGRLVDCDPAGEVPAFTPPDQPDGLPPNNQIVIYELPTAWSISRTANEPERGVATFADVAALVDPALTGANFSELPQLAKGQRYLKDLGVNAIELLPAADSFFKREWGYGTSHYLAPDAELGYPEGNLSSTANRDLAALADTCHRAGIRLFHDCVMAFAHEEPYNHIDPVNFCIDDPGQNQSDPDAMSSGRRDGRHDVRNGFGSTLWRYARQVPTYDPVTGTVTQVFPARQLMLTAVHRWIRDFRADGLRLDSIENVASWDFLETYRDQAHALNEDRWRAAGLDPLNGDAAKARFLVVGEELEQPKGLIRKRLDGLWNENFMYRVRGAIVGNGVGDNFEWTVRKMINPILADDDIADGSEAVNYVTKHDVEDHERLFTLLLRRGDGDELIEKRIKLAFVCLMTAVGIPMFLAGEEFADEHDLFDRNGKVDQRGGKQIDPVNFSRLNAGAVDPNRHDNPREDQSDQYFGNLRRNVLAYVKRLIKLRTSEPALWVNDTDFFWFDFNDGKRVAAWARGNASSPRPVVVLANFSDYASPGGAEYFVPNWPQRTPPPGTKWVEVTQDRDVDPQRVGRESIFAWEAKVYTLAHA